MVNRSSHAARTSHTLAGALAALSTAVAAHGQTVLYVDDDAPLGGNGRSWSEAFDDLQDALWLASYIWEDVEIRIAQGIYTPDRGTGIREASFEIDHTGTVTSGATLGFGMALKGAFAGVKALDPNERDTHRFKSVLSGDLNGDDQPGFGNITDNTLHIMHLEEVKLSWVELNGLVFEGGNSDGSPRWRAAPAVAVIAREPRGHILRLRVQDCTFLRNSGRFGGAVSIGGQYQESTFSHCFFGGNRSGDRAGAFMIEWDASNTQIANCVFSANSSIHSGGAIFSEGECDVVESTFFGNSSQLSGGAIASPGSREFEIYNSILYGNGRDPILSVSRVNVNFSCVEGGFTGAGRGNISGNPLFVNPVGDDGILGTPDDNFLPGFGSPVIDAGLNSAVLDPQGLDYAGQPRIVDDRFTPDTGVGTAPIVDMGAYEFQTPACYADLDQTTGVGVLDLFDFLRFQGLFVYNDPLACQVDRSTGPNRCDIFDFLAFANEFVMGCP